MPYSPTIWVNDTSPALSAANLNKLTNELESQAAAKGISHTLPNWVDGTAPALSDSAPLNEMERVTQAVAAALGLSYTPTSWSSGWTPSRNATRFNKLEQQAVSNRNIIDNPPPVNGDKFASPSGLDSNPGTLALPYLTFRKLADNLAPGQVGMLRGGTYGTASTYQAVAVSGTSGQRITITNYPGESVTIKGYLDVPASYVTISNLHIDGSNAVLNPPDKCGVQALGITAAGTGVIFEYLEIYHSGMKGSGFVVQGNSLTIRYCKIHDIGYCYAYDHGAYVGDGDGVQVYGNWIWNNPHGAGIQVYPSPTNGNFYSNVIDACGTGFYIDDESGTCIGNEVYNNVIANCVGVMGQGGWYDVGGGVTGSGPSGSGNVFRDNCCFNNAGGVGGVPNVTMSGNITSNPLFVNAAAHDYRIQAGSPCAGYGLPNFIVGPTV